MFKEITGVEVPTVIPKRGFDVYSPHGSRVWIRELGDSGHPKIEIDSRTTKNNTLEKITFK